MSTERTELLAEVIESRNLKFGLGRITTIAHEATSKALGVIAQNTLLNVGGQDPSSFPLMRTSIAQSIESGLLAKRKELIQKGIQPLDASKVIALRVVQGQQDDTTIWVGTAKNLVLKAIAKDGLKEMLGSSLTDEVLVEGIGDEDSDVMLYSIPMVLVDSNGAPSVTDRVAVLEANHLLNCFKLHEVAHTEEEEKVIYFLGDGNSWHQAGDGELRDCLTYSIFNKSLNSFILKKLSPKKASEFLALNPDGLSDASHNSSPEELIESTLASATLEQRIFLVNEALQSNLVEINPEDIRPWKETITPQWFEIERSIARKLVVFDREQQENPKNLSFTSTPEVNLDF